ncbi:MAG TPA: hypothetical protein VLQ80_31090 [Candidatus Saccharimonadia bacterium]|nr:hypothetical protein [Candidatus Saccharimonadia bacterium]
MTVLPLAVHGSSIAQMHQGLAALRATGTDLSLSRLGQAHGKRAAVHGA